MSFKVRGQTWLSAHGFSASASVAVLIGVLITVIIGFALATTLLSQVASVNATNKYPSGSPIPGIINLVPLFWFLGIVLAALAIIFVSIRTGLGAGD